MASPVTLDVSGTPRVPFSRLVKVELRKSYDTRAGFWLLVSIAGVVGLILAIATIITVVQTEVVRYGDFVAIAAYITGILLPILAIMLVTSEWSQRSAMVTFTLEPRRPEVVLAKLVVCIVLTLLTLAVALVLGLVCNGICEAANPDLTTWELGADELGGFIVTQVLAMVGGFALATLLLNTPAAIVLFFVYKYALPGVFAIGNSLIGWFEDVSVWLDFQDAQSDIYEWNLSGTEEWSHLVVSGLVWLALPLGLGLWRIMRAEVK